MAREQMQSSAMFMQREVNVDADVAWIQLTFQLYEERKMTILLAARVCRI